ncbi:cell division protein ZapB [Geothrix sp. 21YS21S-4]|uniref:cell division protein ZapB n=1 Tax=Geothrix sp. 21YS21S-4 TaxID=3068889 RepID=UPI0027BB2111|nr:cell division protein ZapB [Geothrix sp. 21YS21S-4]
MDLLKQLESKMQALVQQRNQLKDELDALKAAGAVGDRELQSLRTRLEDALAEKSILEKDREAVKEQVASILRALEALG